MWKPVSVLLWLSVPLAADVSTCACNPADAESMKVRQCSLCAEAEKHPADAEFFFVKDNNPRKPNRWLILPRSHRHDGPLSLHRMTPAQRTRLWKAAIARAKELWGDDWGVAINGDKVRTQCHAHIHIGRFLRAAERQHGFVVVDRPEQIPLPKDGAGMWIHGAGGRIHVHQGEQACETVLLR